MERIGVLAASHTTRSSLLGGQTASDLVPVTREERLPGLFEREVDRGIPDRVVIWWQDGAAMPELRRPWSDEEKLALNRRADDLRTALLPWPQPSRNTLLQEISGMLGAFPSMQRLDKSTALSITLGYLWTVRERPHWAIVRAGAVAGLVGIDGDVVSGVYNLESFPTFSVGLATTP